MSFAIPFIAANNQLHSPSAEDDVPSSAGPEQIAADKDQREQHQDEIERVHRQRTIMLRPPRSDKGQPVEAQRYTLANLT